MANDAAQIHATDEELVGWAFVTNQLLLDSVRNTLLRVEEPSQRAAIEAEYVAGITDLLHTHVAAVTSLLFTLSAEKKEVALGRDVVEITCADTRERTFAEVRELVGEKHALERHIMTLREEVQRVEEYGRAARSEADLIRREVAVEREELEALRRKRLLAAAREEEGYNVEERGLQEVQEEIEFLADVFTQHAGGAVIGQSARGSPGECLRRLLNECVSFTEAIQRAKREPLEKLMAPCEQVEEHQTTECQEESRALYERIVPPPPVNTVARSLLSVREKVQDFRHTTAMASNDIVHTPRIWEQRPYYYSRGDTLATLSPAPRYQSMQSWVMEEVPSAARAWKERMEFLKLELRNLRREIGS